MTCSVKMYSAYVTNKNTLSNSASSSTESWKDISLNMRHEEYIVVKRWDICFGPFPNKHILFPKSRLKEFYLFSRKICWLTYRFSLWRPNRFLNAHVTLFPTVIHNYWLARLYSWTSRCTYIEGSERVGLVRRPVCSSSPRGKWTVPPDYWRRCSIHAGQLCQEKSHTL